MKQFLLIHPMPRLILLILLPLSCLDAKQVNSADAPVGKVHIYKQEGDTAREIEIFFPKDHDPATKAVPGIIMFHGGGQTPAWPAYAITSTLRWMKAPLRRLKPTNSSLQAHLKRPVSPLIADHNDHPDHLKLQWKCCKFW